MVFELFLKSQIPYSRAAAGRPGHGSGQVGSGKFFTGRVGSGQQILKFPRVGSGHGSAKNFQRVRRVKEKCLTGQAGQGKIFHGSDGSNIFEKIAIFLVNFQKYHPKYAFYYMKLMFL